MSVCNTTHNITELSVFSASTSVILFVFTVPLNVLIIYLIWKSQKKKIRWYFFYKLLLNIAFADLMKGIFGDISSIIWHTREALGAGQKYREVDVRLVHISMLLPDAVALVSMVFLSFDRIHALIDPYRNYKGYLHPRVENLVVIFTYPLSVVILIQYFIYSDYIKQLKIFFGCTHTIAWASLLLLTLVYRCKYKKPVSRTSTINGGPGSFTTSMTSLSQPVNERISSASDNNNIPLDDKPLKKQQNLSAAMRKFSYEEQTFYMKKVNVNDQMKRSKSAPSLTKKQHLHDKKCDETCTLSDPLNADVLKTSIHKCEFNQEDSSQLCCADPCIMLRKQVTQQPPIIGYAYYGQQNGYKFERKMKFNKSVSDNKRHHSGSLSDIDIFSGNFTRNTQSTSSRYYRTKAERRVTRTFFIMLAVFMITYIPTGVMVFFMSSQQDQKKCTVTHVLRDLSVLGILSSSLFRALDFIITLKHLKREVLKILGLNRRRRS